MSIYGLIAVLIASVTSWCFGVNYYATIIREGFGTTSAEETSVENTDFYWSRVWAIVDLIALSFYLLLTVPICRAATKPSNRSHMDGVGVRHVTYM